MSERPAPVSKLKIKIDEWRRQIYESRGKRAHRCRRCGTTKGVIRKYGLYICRRCIREVYYLLGFEKTSIHRG
ncbi:MAG: 30S ribosomal protein S14 [Candidatus Njordarchaeales archaeon]